MLLDIFACSSALHAMRQLGPAAVPSGPVDTDISASANLHRLVATFKAFTTDRQTPQFQSGASDRSGHECLYAFI